MPALPALLATAALLTGTAHAGFFGGRSPKAADPDALLNVGGACDDETWAALKALGRIGDGYCDCDDGSDEWGSAACAGRGVEDGTAKALFECPQAGHRPTTVFTSRVGDGVCDCCDGFDEAANPNAQCVNTCAELATAARAGAARRADMMAHAKELLAALVAEGTRERDAAVAQVAAVDTNAALLKTAAAEAREAEGLANAREDDERYRLERAHVTKVHDALSLSALPRASLEKLTALVALRANEEYGLESLLAALQAALPEAIADKMDDVEILSLGVDAMDALDIHIGAGEVAHRPDDEYHDVGHHALPHADEALGAFLAALPLGHFAPDKLEAVAIQVAAELHMTVALAQMVEDERRELGLPAAAPGAGGPVTAFDAEGFSTPEASAARQARADAEAAERGARDAVKAVEPKLARNVGSSAQWWTLQDECFEARSHGHKYRICLYGTAKQDSNSLGRFARWSHGQADGDAAVMEFRDGSKCWKGEDRKLDVVFRCGDQTQLHNVEEPEICSYIATVETPAACLGV